MMALGGPGGAPARGSRRPEGPREGVYIYIYNRTRKVYIHTHGTADSHVDIIDPCGPRLATVTLPYTSILGRLNPFCSRPD